MRTTKISDNEITRHLRMLQGTLNSSDIVQINATIIQAKGDINIYQENEHMLTLLEKEGKLYDHPEQFTKYLIDNDLVKILKRPNPHIEKYSRLRKYQLFPFSPKWKNVEYAVQKLALKLKNVVLLRLKPEDIYVYSMIKFLNLSDLDNKDPFFESTFKLKIIEAREALKEKENQWFMDKNNGNFHR